MSKEIIMDFISKIKDDKERNEWIKMVKRNYNHEKELKRIHQNKYNRSHSVRHYKSYAIENEILKKPAIAFDFFDGKFNIKNKNMFIDWLIKNGYNDIARNEWTKKQDENTICLYCKMNISTDNPECKNIKHKLYSKYLKEKYHERYIKKVKK